jgi:hypothetical protein
MLMGKHHEMGPSRANALWYCPGFEGSEEESPAMARGTAMHACIAEHFSGAFQAGGVPASAADADAVQWGIDWIFSLQAKDLDYKLYVEQELDFPGEDPFGPPITAGTLDYLLVTPTEMHVIDIKTGQPRDHSPQIKLYALMAMHHFGRSECQTHLVYVDHRMVHSDRYTRQTCEAFLNQLLDRVDGGKLSPCQYCSWCERQVDCPAILERVETVAQAQSWELIDYTPGAMLGAHELGRAYDLACMMEKWAEAVKRYVADRAKSGEDVAGYRLATRASPARVKDVLAAYHAAGLPSEKFLECCQVKVGDLRDAFVAANADTLNPVTGKRYTKKDLAGKIFERIMEDAMERGADIAMMQKCKVKKQAEIVGDCIEDAEI